MSDIQLYTASWLYNPGHPPVPGGALAVRDGLLLAVGTATDLQRQFGPATADYPGCVLMPGFVNAHTHLELTHVPAWRLKGGLDFHPHGFVDWIVQMVKIRRGVSPDEVMVSLKAGIAASLRAGTTCVGDIVTIPSLLDVYKESCIAAQLYLELIGQEAALFENRLHSALTAADSFAGIQQTGFSPHAPYTLNGAVLPAIAAAAQQSGRRLALHLAESADESRLLFDSTGPLADLLYPLVGWSDFLPSPRRTTPARFFDQGGLLGPSTLAVHCVHLTPADAALLKERAVAICLCPRSNERLNVGAAPVRLFKKLGIPLCIGTDSLASNDSLSLWDEIRFALDSYNGELTPDELLQMATSGGAGGIGLSASAGALDAGKRADVQVIEMSGDCSAENLLERGKLFELLLAGRRC